MRKNSCGESEHNCETCEDEWFGDERTNGTVIEHTCGKETLSKLTPENIKKTAKMANQDQRDLMDKALPNWEVELKNGRAANYLYYKHQRCISQCSKQIKEDIAYKKLKDFIRRTIKTEREQAVKGAVEDLENLPNSYCEHSICIEYRSDVRDIINKLKAKYDK